MRGRTGIIVTYTNKHGEEQIAIAFRDKQKVSEKVILDLVNDDFSFKVDPNSGKHIVVVKTYAELKIIGFYD